MSTVSQAWSVVDPTLKSQQAHATAEVSTVTDAEKHMRSASGMAITKGCVAAHTPHGSTGSSLHSTVPFAATTAPTKTSAEQAMFRHIRYV